MAAERGGGGVLLRFGDAKVNPNINRSKIQARD
jgi:hypothetical protein